MTAQQNLHELADSIKAGICLHGVHVIDACELSGLLEHVDPHAEFEKRLCLENFAHSHGLDVHWSTFLQVAIFRNPDAGARGPL